jgi:type VI secretion system protein ImpK
MSERAETSFFLLSRFAEFFEELCRIKQAIADGRLGAVLTVGDETPPTEPGDLASRVSARLAGVLHAQWMEVSRTGTAEEMKAHRMALYVMTALADELFILEIDWPGRESWLNVLLEYKLFRSRNAGTRVFDIADRLLATHDHGTLHVDLAAVLVLALQLGFRGQYRGGEGAVLLEDMRERLFRVVAHDHPPQTHGPAFPQAVQHLQSGGKAMRLAPLTPWFAATGIALLAYLVVSTALWFQLIEPLQRSMGAG